MKKYAIYARFSSPKQNPLSTADQIALCKRYIFQQANAVLYKTYADDSISGVLKDRPALNQMIDDAQRKCFDVLVVESQDRLSRNQALTATLYEKFVFWGIQIYTLEQQILDKTKVAIGGLLSSMYIDQLSLKTIRGQDSAIERGIIPCKCVYGYRRNVDKTWRKDTFEAGVIQAIFKGFLGDLPIANITNILRQDNILPPKNTRWVEGQVRRILQRKLYTGIFEFRKTKHVLDPTTNKKIVTQNPRDKIVTKYFSHLKIISERDFIDAQKKIATFSCKSHTQTYLFHQKIYCTTCRQKLYIANTKKNTKNYCYLRCYGTKTQEQKLCKSSQSLSYTLLVKKVLEHIAEYLQNNPGKVYNSIVHYKQTKDMHFERNKEEICEKMREMDSFVEAQKYLESFSKEYTINTGKIFKFFCTHKSLYERNNDDTATIDALNIFVKKIYASRKGRYDTKDFIFTFDIDWQNIHKNLYRFV